VKARLLRSVYLHQFHRIPPFRALTVVHIQSHVGAEFQKLTSGTVLLAGI
jgi:hypothetical protein